jgi:hypothetical protein
MKKLSEYSSAIFVILVAGIAIISGSSGSTLSINEAMAFHMQVLL